MATVVRNVDPVLKTVCDAHNDLKLQVGAGSNFHLDASESTVTAANATDLPTSLVLTNQILAVYKFHMADLCAHKVAGVALASYVNAVDLTTVMARANDIKAKFNTHIASTTFHYNADSTNTIATANATDLASTIALMNATKTAFNTHMASAPSSKSLRLVDA